MTTESSRVIVPALSSRPIARGNWPVTLTKIARVMVFIPALIGVFAWLTLVPVLLLTFLFVQPLLVIGIAMFLIAAAFGGKTILLHHYRAGDTVYTAGDLSDFIYLVRSGQLEGTGTGSTAGEKQKYGPGDSFGIHALLTHGRHAYTVRALSDAEVIRIDPVDLSGFIDVPQLDKILHELLDAGLTDLTHS
jgi:CRP-like cAMP-binding protein